MTDRTVTRIFRNLRTSLNGNTIVTDTLSFAVTGGDLPDGTVLNFGATVLTVGTDSHVPTAGQEQWNLQALGLSPTWAEDQELTVCANLPPGLESATVEGTSLVLTYTEDLDASSVPLPGAYSVTVDGTAAAPSSVSVSGKTVTLTLAEAVTAGRSATVTYTPGSNPVQDGSGLDALPLAGEEVDIRDETPPEPASGTVLGAGDRLTLTFTEDLDIGPGKLPPASAFTVKADGAPVTVQDVTLLNDLDHFLLTLSSTIKQGRTVTVDYTVPGDDDNPIQDVGGNKTGNFTFAVDNNSTVEGIPPEPASGTVPAAGDNLSLTFNEDLDIAAVPPASAFTVKADGVEVTVQSVAASLSDTLALSLSSTIKQGRTVTVDYRVPTTNPIRDVAGNEAAAFTDFAVDNNSTVEGTPPEPASGAVLGAGDRLTLTFTEDLDIGPGKLPPASAFTVKADGAPVTVQDVTLLTDLDHFTLILSSTIGARQIVTVSYAVPTTGTVIEDTAGNDAVAFEDFPVTNNSTVANTTPPVPASGAVLGAGDRLTLTFNEDLDIGPGKLPPASAFTVKADGAPVTVQDVTLLNDLDHFLLNLSSTIGARQIVTVSYAVPTTGTVIADEAGNETLAFTDFPVTNNSTVANTTPPVPASAVVPASGASLTLTFNEDLDIAADSLPAPGAFTVVAVGADGDDDDTVTVESVALGTGPDRFVLTLPDDAIKQCHTVTVDYTVPATNPIQDTDDNDAAEFTGFPVDNNSTVECPSLNPPVFPPPDPRMFSVDENTPVGTAIDAPVTATDADGDTLTYSLQGLRLRSRRQLAAEPDGHHRGRRRWQGAHGADHGGGGRHRHARAAGCAGGFDGGGLRNHEPAGDVDDATERGAPRHPALRRPVPRGGRDLVDGRRHADLLGNAGRRHGASVLAGI